MTFALAATTELESPQASTLEKWLIMPGPVIEGHADIESECDACHDTQTEREQGELCVACHEDVGRDILAETGFHGRVPAGQRNQCSDCHTDHEGRDVDVVALDESTFDHSMTDFELRGAHIGVECAACHLPDTAHRDAQSDCVGCHRQDDVHRGELGESCDACHVESDWRQASFDHGSTGFLLTGAHVAAQCSACHQSETFADVGRTCVACHRAEDVHRGRNGTQCADCHISANWHELTFNHLAVSGFALTAGHDGLGCQDCHKTADFRDRNGANCNACHSDDDVHEGRNGVDCESCHSVAAWQSTSFDHNTATDFPLPQGHESLACTSCHTSNVHDAVPRECGSCHLDDDVHEGQLGKVCENCHVATRWTDELRFDHDITSFPLLGAHANVSCDSCHTSAAYRDAQDNCVDCHSDDDTHRGGLGEQCDACHNPADWSAWRFDHDIQTTFPLTGAHIAVSCDRCHVPDRRRDAALSADCNACHRRDDPHLGRFGNNCGSCHVTSSFSQAGGR